MELENERQLAAIVFDIQNMAKADQEARSAGDPAVTVEVDQKNQNRLKEIIGQIGWPTKSKVGEEVAHATWLIVQHADNYPEFQRECLDVMQKEEDEEVEREDIAYLEDRIRVNEGRPQLYGTQWKVDEKLGYIPEEIEDIDNLEKRRKEMSMDPFSEFSEAMQKMYAEWKKKQEGQQTIRSISQLKMHKYIITYIIVRFDFLVLQIKNGLL